MTSVTVGNYRLVEKLGEGGMGAVYKGVDLMVERDVAIKMLRPEIARQPEVVERFRAEAVALAKLNHPNIATLYSFFREGDEYFMVMEYVLGRTLEAILRGSPPMPAERAIAVASQVLDAIEHAHSYGILHRDIKPANIMLTAAGQAKVTDFGIARVLGTARMTREGCVYGTLEYLAPERIRGQEADLRSDLYSMGVVLYEMLSCRLPFVRDTEYELMRAHLEETPPPFASFGLSSISPRLELTVTKALAKRPEERFGTAGEFRSALAGTEPKRVLETAGIPVAPPAGFSEVAPFAAEAPATPASASSTSIPAVPVARKWKLYGALAVALVLIGLMLAYSWSGKQRALEATKPAPAPVVAQPSAPSAPPEAAGQAGVEPASSSSQQGTGIQEAPTTAPAGHEQVTAMPATNAVKPKSVKSTPGSERRKAALEALNKGETPPSAPKKKEKDPRSSSLKALDE